MDGPPGELTAGQSAAEDDFEKPRPWLVALKVKARQKERPRDKAFGRWLGDFLNQDTPNGLLKTELLLLDSCGTGVACAPPLTQPQAQAHGSPQSDGEPASQTALWARIAALVPAVINNRVRAEFLRFLVLGGDDDAPVHEAGIQLFNAFVDCRTSLLINAVDLRQCKCGSRFALINSVIEGKLAIEDGSLGLLILSGTCLTGIDGQRAKIAGTVFLDEQFVSTGPVSLIGAEIGGALQCAGATLQHLGKDAADPRAKTDYQNITMLELSRAKISGAVFLDRNVASDGKKQSFSSDGAISLIGTQIGGNLDCVGARIDGALRGDRAKIGGNLRCREASLAGGLSFIGAVIAGDVDFTSLTAKRAITLLASEIGGTLRCSAVSLQNDKTDSAAATMFDASKATIKGDVKLMTSDGIPFRSDGGVSFVSAKIGGNMYFSGAAITAARAATDDSVAIDAQSVKVGGSVSFGGGFAARGMVSLYGAEISRDLDFSGSSFRNKSGTAILASFANVLGGITFQTNNAGPGNPYFKSFGAVSLAGVKCGELNCSGSIFVNPAAANNSSAWALDCGAIKVAGSVFLRNVGDQPFTAFGGVSFFTAIISGHLYCEGGVFKNGGTTKRSQPIRDPKASALECGSLNVAGMVRLCNDGGTPFRAFGQVSFYFAQIGVNLECGGGRFTNPKGDSLDCQGSNIKGCVFLNAGSQYWVDDVEKTWPAFWSDGVVRFTGASVGLQFVCQGGHFRNSEEDKGQSGQAAVSLDLSVAKIGDTLYLGRGNTGREVPTIEGSVDLTAATVRVLIDNGLINDESQGLRPTVDGKDDAGVTKTLKCNLKLDQFSYDRLRGDKACDSDMRGAWLRRQPPEDLGEKFKPQPFEQLITVMRAMGYDDDADEIARSKRIYEWKAAWMRRVGPVRKRLAPLREYRLTKALRRYGAAMRNAGSFLIGGTNAALFGGKAIAVVVAAWLIIIGHAWWVGLTFLLLVAWKPAALTWKILTSAMEFLFVNKFIGYGFQMGRAVVLLLLLIGVFGSFYNRAFEQGAIVPADKDVRDAASQPAALLETVPPSNKFSFKLVAAPECKIWSVTKCRGIADQAIPLFNPWLYSADVMVPIVTFGQKAAWAPTPNVGIKLPVVGQLEAPSNVVYDVQLFETILGWVEGFLLVSFVTGLIAKE